MKILPTLGGAAVALAACLAALLMAGFLMQEGAVSLTWTPPPGAMPASILAEAQNDARARRNEEALAKFLWIHRHSLEVDPSYVGVRLSFALDAWRDLGSRYRPAWRALKAERDATEKALRSGDRDDWQAFQDLAALNKVLGDDEETVRVFEWLDAERPSVAARVYPLVEGTLARKGRHALCDKYLEPGVTTEKLIDEYLSAGRMADALPGGRENYLNFAKKRFVQNSSLLVALLVKNGREQEADAVMQKILSRVDEPEAQTGLEQARAGRVPRPWP